MENLYERVVRLLQQEDGHKLVAELADELGEEPVTMGQSGASFHDHTFGTKAISLCCIDNRIDSVFFCIRAIKQLETAENFSTIYYTGDLPCGIRASDNRKEIETKMGVAPSLTDVESCGDITDLYDYGPYRMAFLLDASGERLRTLCVTKASV